MKIRTISIILYFIIGTYTINAQTYKVDVIKSKLNWRSTKITGEHSGTIKVKNGEIVIENGKITGGEFVIDMNGIIVLDTEDLDKRKDIVDDIGGKTFFNIAKYPTAKFVIKGYANDMLSGELTIKGITKHIKFTTNYKIIDKQIIANTVTFSIDRQLWNLKLSNWIKDVAVDDPLEFKVHIVAKLKI